MLTPGLGQRQLLITDVSRGFKEVVAVGTDLRIAELLDAVVPHALGELERRLEASVPGGSGSPRRRRGRVASDRAVGTAIVIRAGDHSDRQQQRNPPTRRVTTTRRTYDRRRPRHIGEIPLRSLIPPEAFNPSAPSPNSSATWMTRSLLTANVDIRSDA